MSDRALTGLLRGSYTYVLPTSLQPSLLCQAPLRLASIVRALQPSFPVFLLEQHDATAARALRLDSGRSRRVKELN